MISELIEFVRSYYKSNDFIPLHAPVFNGDEKAYICDTIDSTFVSSVGKYVDKFESAIQAFTSSQKVVAVTNGTAALNAALYTSGARSGDLVITQPLTFVATCNVLFHLNMNPIFVDVSKVSMGLCPKALEEYLSSEADLRDDGICVHKKTSRRISAVLPMHTFGHPVEIDSILKICDKWNLALIEDAAESLGSFYKDKHTGTFGQFGAISFNGNKIITTGGGGAVLCKNLDDAQRLKHLTTTAKIPHEYEYFHDEAGFNYRMPNVNAALGLAQIEQLTVFLQKKRQLAKLYENLFDIHDYEFFKEPSYAHSNYWLNAIICPDYESRKEFLEKTNKAGIMTRPIWTLMHKLPMYNSELRGSLENSEWFESRVVNIPSSVRFS